MRAKDLPPVETLRDLFNYDEVTGIVTWKKGIKRHGSGAGDIAGTKQKAGYILVRIYKQNYLLHRIIWKLHTGEEPCIIDHINGDKSDNRICNLRSTTYAHNNYNMGLSPRNTSGHRGVTLTRGKVKPWLVQLGRQHIGTYSTFEEAVEARLQAEKQREIYVRVD
jgi:hypothetical protein